ncbi:MAG: thiamine-phosphate kinase [Moraxellaceae bacterium]|nr:thiamine-phosphate kinase [Moraxellaceae bacterium]
MDEFALIRQFFTQGPTRPDVSAGIGDDAALLQVPVGQELVVTTDTLVAGRHFPDDAAAFDIGWKSLAVNLSDLAAMGAEARWVTLALTLPTANESFLREFARGFFALAAQEQVALVGGDTTRGPLSVTVTAMGTVPTGQALRRGGAVAGDDLWISAPPGDAALGLQIALGQWADELPDSLATQALERLHRPTPRLALGLALRPLASACLDVSDGLAQDLGHLLAASGTGAELDLGLLPQSPALRHIDPAFASVFALTGGDDYELLFTAPASSATAVQALGATRIGRITAMPGLRLFRDGTAVDMPLTGYTHF